MKIIIVMIFLALAGCENNTPEYISKMREIHGRCNAQCEALNLKGKLDFDGFCQCKATK